jgi:hypothetical protein
MKELIDTLVGHASDHWVKIATAAAFMLIGWFFGKRRAKANWAKKEFLDRLNVSLNVIENGKLLIRTILEKRCEDVFLNSVAAETVVQASRQTTADDPLLPLPKDDYWYYLNAVLNEIAEKFAEGQIRRDMGLPVQKTVYVMCLTSESAGPLKTRKVRAMVVRKSLLEKLPAEPPAVESPHHVTRWETLKKLAAAYQTTPHRFLEMEICV